MSDWDEIRRLAADLQKVQLSSTMQRYFLIPYSTHDRDTQFQLMSIFLFRLGL